MQILQICKIPPEISRKLLIFQTDVLLKCWVWSGAKVCTSCGNWKMLSTPYLLAKFRFDKAENEPAKNLQTFAKKILIFPILLTLTPYTRRDLLHGRPPGELQDAFDLRAFRRGLRCRMLQIFGGLVLGCIKTKFCKKICVWQHFSIATICAHFCTAPNSTF